MQDLKSMGGQTDIKLGNKEAVFLVGALFIVLVVVFGLGVVVGKRLYGQLPMDTAMNSPQHSPIQSDSGKTAVNATTTKPADSKPTEPDTTPESPSFYDLKNDNAGDDTGADTGNASDTGKKPDATATDKKDETPLKPEPPKAEPPKPKFEWNYAIHAGSFRDRTRAEKFVKQLEDKGLDAWTHEFKQSGTGKLFIGVRVGHYKDKAEAQAQMDAMKMAGIIPEDSILAAK